MIKELQETIIILKGFWYRIKSIGDDIVSKAIQGIGHYRLPYNILKLINSIYKNFCGQKQIRKSEP